MNKIDNSTKIEMLCELASNRLFDEMGETQESFNRNYNKMREFWKKYGW